MSREGLGQAFAARLEPALVDAYQVLRSLDSGGHRPVGDLDEDADEGAKILEEGKAYRASDIDIVWLNGYGFPAYRGAGTLSIEAAAP